MGFELGICVPKPTSLRQITTQTSSPLTLTEKNDGWTASGLKARLMVTAKIGENHWLPLNGDKLEITIQQYVQPEGVYVVRLVTKG